jgi:hypothetical protein
LCDRREVVLPHRVAVVRRNGVLEELAEDGVPPDLRVDDLPRNLALAETGDLDLSRDLAIGAIEVLAELIRRDLDRESYLVLVGLFDG